MTGLLVCVSWCQLVKTGAAPLPSAREFPAEVSRVPAPKQPARCRPVVWKAGAWCRLPFRLPRERSRTQRDLAGRGVDGTAALRRRLRWQVVPLPRLRPADPTGQGASGRLARARGRARPAALAHLLLERQGPPERQAPAVPQRAQVLTACAMPPPAVGARHGGHDEGRTEEDSRLRGQNQPALGTRGEGGPDHAGGAYASRFFSTTYPLMSDASTHATMIASPAQGPYGRSSPTDTTCVIFEPARSGR
jgi:hypothetical protein